MKKYTNKILIAIIIVLLALNVFNACSYIQKSNDYDRIKTALSLADLQNQKFTTTINDKNQEISTQKQVILSKDEAIESQLVELEELREYKRLERKIVTQTITKVDTLFISFTPTSDSLDIELPPFRKAFQYQEKDNWFALSGNVTNLGVNIDSMSIRNKYSLIIGDKKLGWFKKPSPEIQWTNENPFTTTISMKNVHIEYIMPFYKRNEFWAGLGAVLGFILRGL